LRVLHGEYAKFLAVTVLTAIGVPNALDRGSKRGESRAAS